MLHHSLTRDSQTVSWGAIRRYHTDPAGPYRMRDIGYHFGVELIDDVSEVLVGRLLTMDGAHCREAEMNRRAIGICLVGAFDVAAPPDGQWTRARDLVLWLCRLHDLPAEAIVGHRQYAPYKSCPGLAFNLDSFRAAVGALLRAA